MSKINPTKETKEAFSDCNSFSERMDKMIESIGREFTKSSHIDKKFRAAYGEDGNYEWIYFTLKQLSQWSDNGLVCPHYDWQNETYIHFDDFEQVDQYVGTNDNNGDKVYERDIIAYRKFDKNDFCDIKKDGVVQATAPVKGIKVDWINEDGQANLYNLKKESLEFTTSVVVIGNTLENDF